MFFSVSFTLLTRLFVGCVGFLPGSLLNCKVMHMTSEPQVLATLTPEASRVTLPPHPIDPTLQLQAKLLLIPTSRAAEQDGKEGIRKEGEEWEPEVVVTCTHRSSTREAKLQEYRAALQKEEAKCKAAVKALGKEVLALAERISSLAGWLSSGLCGVVC